MTTATTSISPRPVQVSVGDAVLNADLAMPEHARGFVVFAHGSRLSSRNRTVALALQHGAAAAATHLFEEPGTLERVVELAIEWFERHLTKPE
jgi:hypothetical protein